MPHVIDSPAIRAHVASLDECNQRGGRMLSLVDLITAGTVDLGLAAYLAAAMRSGASLLVGARPGGAGKTTVMCALLNFLPDRTALCAVEDLSVLEAAQHSGRPGDICYLAHEVGSGHYYAYIWGQRARAFFALAAQRHVIATNLHADTLLEAREQLCGQNGVPESHVDAVTLKVFLGFDRASHAPTRWVSQVYESNGRGDSLIWRGEGASSFARTTPSMVITPTQERMYGRLLAEFLRQDTRRIDQIRLALQGFGEVV